MGEMLSFPKLQRQSVTRELDMGSQPSEYLARSGVAGGGYGQIRGEYPGNPGVSSGTHANPNANPFVGLSPIVLCCRMYLRTVKIQIRLHNTSQSYRIML